VIAAKETIKTVKQVDPTLLNHLQQSVTTLTWCWRIERTDGLVQGFTALDQDLVIAGVTYKAATGFFPSAIQTTNQLDINNAEAASLLDDDSISERDLVGGKYDFAKLDLFLVNYLDLPTALNLDPPKHLVLMSGILGQVTNSDRTFKVECRSKAQALTQKIVQVTSKTCRAEFGDSDCKVNLAPYTHNLTVASTSNNRLINITGFSQADGYFDEGKLIFTNGDNNGLEFTIQSYSGGTITLFETTPYTIAVGNSFRAIAGCRKTLSDCSNRYGNVLNFRGEPHIPGADKLFAGFQG
jgi:uncharacterized phage protein (TIGR02218 family)